MAINIDKSVIGIILNQLEKAKSNTNSDYSEKEARYILSKYQRGALELLPFAKGIENFSVTKYENGNELIKAKLVYKAESTPYSENNFMIFKHHDHPVLELVNFTKYLAPYGTRKELPNTVRGVIVEKTNYEFWRNGFHLSNFATYKRCDNEETVLERFQKGYTLTQSPYLITGAPFEGNISLDYTVEGVHPLVRVRNAEGKIIHYNRPDLVEDAIVNEYKALVDETGLAITTGKVKKLSEMKY